MNDGNGNSLLDEEQRLLKEELSFNINEMLGSGHHYNYHDALSRLVNDILNPMFASNKTWKASIKPTTMERFKRLKPHKKELVEVLVTIFTIPNLFQDFWQRLSEPCRALLETLQLKGPQLPLRIQQETGFQITTSRGRLMVMECTDPLILFFTDYAPPIYWSSFVPQLLSIDPTLAAACKKYLPNPEVPLVKGEPSSDLERFQDPHVATWFHQALTYVDEGNLKALKSGRAFTVPSLTTMAREIGLDDFFTKKDKPWLHSRKEMVAALAYFRRGPVREPSIEDMRSFFQDLFQDTAFPYLFFLKNYSSPDYSKTHKNFGTGLEQSLRLLKDGDWVEADSLFWHAVSKNLPIDVFHEQGDWKVSVSRALYTYTNYCPKELSTRPGFYMGLFLMAAFGLVDLAYLPPSRFQNPLLETTGEPVLTPYDGLKWVRLTPLGAYVLGVTMEPPAEVPTSQRAEVTLNDHDLIISVNGDDPSLRAFLAMIAKIIGPNRYLVDFQSFFQGLDKGRLESRIELFKKRIPATITANWERFFEEALNRAKPLVPREDMVVFHVADNPTLAHHLVRDPKLRELVVKAENQFILVERSRVSSLRQRLRQLGFLL